MLIQVSSGILIAAAVSYAAYRAGSLNQSGAWGAFLEGVVIFGLGGWPWAILLLAFFVSSSVLTRTFGTRKAGLAEKFEKGGQRDIGQVLANGGIAALFAGLHFFFPGASWTWMGFAGSLAAVNADTWATELGVLNPSMPRLVTRLRLQVERGTSGGVSLYGTLAAIGGAALIGLLAGLLGPQDGFCVVIGVTILSGFLGAMFDSLLGATVQAIYRCPSCDKETERTPVHSCGEKTARIRGWLWLNNDRVNLACAAIGALTGALAGWWIF